MYLTKLCPAPSPDPVDTESVTDYSTSERAAFGGAVENVDLEEVKVSNTLKTAMGEEFRTQESPW